MELLKVHVTKRSFLGLLIQYSVILSWVSIFISSISSHYPDIATLSSSAFSLFTALSIFAGALSLGKSNMRSYSIYAWSLISPIVTISLIFVSEIWFLIAVCLLGGLYGNFILGFFINFGELAVINERGRAGGFIGFMSILIMLVLTGISSILGFFGSAVLCSVLSLCPFFATRLDRVQLAELEKQRIFSIKTNYAITKDFYLYLMPWLIYNLVNVILGRYGTTLLIDRFQIPTAMRILLLNVTSCIGALLGGSVADTYGRKKALGIGLTSYGISSALSGFIFSEIQDSLLIFLLFALNSLSWGIFLVLYFFVVWEDLSNMNNNSFYYAGIGVYPLSMAIAQFLPLDIRFPFVNLALVSCILIFSSNIFLAAADELLSPESRKELDIFVYLEQVKAFFRKHHEEST